MNRKNILSLVVVFILTIVLLNGCDVLSELFGLNEPPIADAGPDQSDVIVGTLVTLDGSLSSDPDGDQLTYRWSFQAFGLGSTLHDDQI
ncbi:MAG: hypothetical protein JW741_19005, partial [Sedimentisphaerales bacterium]|nr:hypothetical protein [Sedimentisphaerales bacterium]